MSVRKQFQILGLGFVLKVKLDFQIEKLVPQNIHLEERSFGHEPTFLFPQLSIHKIEYDLNTFESFVSYFQNLIWIKNK